MKDQKTFTMKGSDLVKVVEKAFNHRKAIDREIINRLLPSR